jgi:hypothetical protein
LWFANIYTISLLQPKDQGTIATFKAYYIRNTFEQAIAKTTDDAISLTEFRKNYNIRHATENTLHSVFNAIFHLQLGILFFYFTCFGHKGPSSGVLFAKTVAL